MTDTNNFWNLDIPVENHLKNLKELVEAHKLISIGQSNMEKEFLQIIQDKNIPLNTRWEYFMGYPFERHNGSITDFVHKYDLSPYDDFYVEQYETVDYRQFIKAQDVKPFTEETLTDEVKESLLAEGYTTFEYDW